MISIFCYEKLVHAGQYFNDPVFSSHSVQNVIFAYHIVNDKCLDGKLNELGNLLTLCHRNSFDNIEYKFKWRDFFSSVWKKIGRCVTWNNFKCVTIWRKKENILSNSSSGNNCSSHWLKFNTTCPHKCSYINPDSH